jgi:hypothetical protein
MATAIAMGQSTTKHLSAATNKSGRSNTIVIKLKQQIEN